MGVHDGSSAFPYVLRVDRHPPYQPLFSFLSFFDGTLLCPGHQILTSGLRMQILSHTAWS